MNIKNSLLTVSLALSLSATHIAVAENVIKVPRESGAVHTEFKTLLSDYIKRFDSGIGRIALALRQP